MKKFKQILGVLLVVAFAALLIACNGDETGTDPGYGERQIPVFLGMTATSNVSMPTSHSRTTSSTISNTNTTNTNSWLFVNNQWVIHDPSRSIDNAQIFGWYDGNGYYHTWSESWFLYLLNKGVGVFGSTNPFPDGDIIGEINSTLGVITSDEIAYYANPNSEILINIHLSNPDEFTILSFVFNGRRFQPFEFLPGSNSELLIIRVPLNQTTGIREFTLDEILYIEGTEVKNVILHGNQTILVGVRGVNNISVNKTNLTTCLETITFNLNITDRDNLIDLENLNAVIYDGYELLQTIPLTLGHNQVTFDNLSSNTIFQVVVFSHFDDLSGAPVGATTHKLLNEFIVTDAPVNFYFSNTVVTQNSIEFDFDWHTQVNNPTMINRLYHQGVLVEETGQLRFTNLLSNNEYTIVSTFVNNQGVNESIEKTFRTLAKATPTIEIIDVVASQSTISFDLSILDVDGVGSIYSIELMLDGVVVQSITNFDELAFIELLSSNEYKIRVVYVFDLNDGVGERATTATYLVTTEAKATPTIEIIDVVASQSTISFDLSILDVDGVGSIYSIELLLGQVVVRTLTDFTELNFESLLSNNEYTIRVVYKYDLNDGVDEQEVSVTRLVTTEAKATPTVEVIEAVVTQTSISFELDIIDVDSVGAIYAIELMLDGVVVQSITNFDELAFIELLSSNEYKIRVVYVFDLNDGVGERATTAIYLVTTEAKATPTVGINSILATQTSINFNISINDKDEVGVISSIALFSGQILVYEMTDLTQRVFEKLVGLTTYTILVTYLFDLNDGVGIQYLVISQDAATLANLFVTNTIVRNTSSIAIGELIFIEVQLHNPASIPIMAVEVNGRVFNPTTISTHNRLFIEFIIDEYFEGGLTYMTIEALHYIFNGQGFLIEVDENNYSTAFINGILEVLSIDVVNSDMEVIHWGFPNATYYLLIRLQNSTGYYIEDISIISSSGGVSLTFNQNFVVSKNQVMIPFSLSAGWFSMRREVFSITEITYFNDDLRRSDIIGDVETTFHIVRDMQTMEVSTADDLLNMNSGHHFILTNDIDLAGREWIPNNFGGVFNGNGFTIRNMTVVREFENTNIQLGLFANANGVIYNLVIENTLIMAINHTHGITVGALASWLDRDGLVHSVTEMGGLISIQGRGARVGGLIGENQGTLTNSRASSDVSVISQSWVSAGGLVGLNSVGRVTNNLASGNVSATGLSEVSAGGLVGFNNAGRVTNNLASGSVSANGQSSVSAGGLVGHSGNSREVTNNLATGNHGVGVGGVFGRRWGYGEEFHTLSFFINGISSFGETQATIEQLISLDWQLANLNWSQSLWLFMDGQLPQLRSFLN